MTGRIAAMRFASASRGWVAVIDSAGALEVRFTSDGGGTWTTGLRTMLMSPNATLDAATIDTAWLLTMDGRYCTASDCSKWGLFRTTDGGLSWSNLGNPKDYACSGGVLKGPLFTSASRGWLALNLGAGGVNVGPGGLLATDDGGKTWHCATSPPNTDLLSAADPLHVWVTSEDKIAGATTVYTTDDGGGTWRSLDLGALGQL
jgi:hypothetical protein